MRATVLVSAVVAALTFPRAAAHTSVRVWEDTIELPTYAEGAPNPNAPFDLFSFGRFNYPYPIRDALTDRREPVRWRSLRLENEYLRLTVLPDLGGHVYGCLDKRTGREMFYANTSIKKALIGYRGAWAAFGVEFNFPVSHNWMSMSPVDFATSSHADGSASIIVGNTDQVYGARWLVELRLSPGRSLLEQRVDLYNASDVRHRYYWWSNAAVQAWEDSRLVYPTELMATHGFTSIEPWPLDRDGRDLSIIRNQTSGPVSLFTHETREPFVGVYHGRTSSGTVHVASPAELPTHKVWSWGNDREAAAWRTALSDDESGYVELQAGLFRNQETYAFLEPQESVRFSEYWLPVRDLEGITRANTDAVLHLHRRAPALVAVALDVTRDLPDARVKIRQGAAALLERTLSLSPRDVWRADVPTLGAEPVTFELTDRQGTLVLAHSEGRFDLTPAARARLGPTGQDRAARRDVDSAAAILERATAHELEGRRLRAIEVYRQAIDKYSATALMKAGGRLAVALGWPEADIGPSTDAVEWLTRAYARNTTDFETRYYLGLALAAGGRRSDARVHLEAASRFRETRTPSLLALARLSSVEGKLDEALRHVRIVSADAPRASIAGGLEVSVLRRLGRTQEARDRVRWWRTIDPASSLLRYEATLAGDPDPGLWGHLGAEANRVLDLADEYLSTGAYADALALLERDYPAVDPPRREPGAVAPQDSPLVAYYRGYARERLGSDARRDYGAARGLPTTYVFPARRSSHAVLRAALRTKPDDATARFLLGSLYLSAGLVDQAIETWQRVRQTRPAVPTLHRNLGLALLHGRADYKGGQAVLEEGVDADARNVEVYLALDGALSAAGAPPRERVAALRRYPDAAQMPASMVFKLALALAEAGDGTAAERLFHDRFFPREEGGTSVRSVYAQVLLSSAAAAADKHDCAAAGRIADSLATARPDLPFAREGLADTAGPPAMARQLAAIEWQCGRRAAARGRWERLERAARPDGGSYTGGPVVMAIGAEASRRLGRSIPPERRRALEDAVEAAALTIESGGTSHPGGLELARGLLLGALGRPQESRRALQRVFVFPDRNLSHAQARSALRAFPPEAVR